MKTFIRRLNFVSLFHAKKLILSGQVVAFPTETVYGLGASVFDESAIAKIFVAKGRPQDNPLIAHISDKKQISQLASRITSDAQKIIDNFMPGSITVVLPKRNNVPDRATGGLSTVAIRMPESKQARRFISACKVPLVAPSANTSGRPSPTTAEEVFVDMNGKIPLVLKGRKCKVGIESTVLDCTGEVPVILRPGKVTKSQIEKVLGKKVEMLSDTTQRVNSPGVRYKHYAPNCPAVLSADGDTKKVCAYYNEQKQKGLNPVVMCLDGQQLLFVGCETFSLGITEEQFAENLYGALRRAECKYDCIIIAWYSQTEFGESIYNRLERVVGHNFI